MYQKFFQPRNVLVCSPAHDRTRILPRLIKNIKTQFGGKIFNVRVNSKQKKGELYSSVSQIIEEVDLAILKLPVSQLLTTLRECGEQGIKFVVILSTTNSRNSISKKLKEKITAVGTRYGMNILGPRSGGFLNTCSGFNPSIFDLPKKGYISVISTSIHRTEEILKWGKDQKIGFSSIFTLGEMAGLTENELMIYLDQDKHTKIILLCLEKLTDEKNFLRLVEMISKRKNIVMISCGSLRGERFANSESYTRIAEKGAMMTHSLPECFNVLDVVFKIHKKYSFFELLRLWQKN